MNWEENLIDEQKQFEIVTIEDFNDILISINII
jgi:hypothetical protein